MDLPTIKSSFFQQKKMLTLSSTLSFGEFTVKSAIKYLIQPLLFTLLLLGSDSSLLAQSSKIYATSGNSNDWNVAAAWIGGIVPPTTFNGGVQVFVNHDLMYDGQTMSIRNGSIEVASGVSLMMLIPNLKFESGGTLTVRSGGRMYVTGDPGNFTNGGNMTLEPGAYFECAGNFSNNGMLTISDACLRMTLKSFTNTGQLLGNGSIHLLRGTLQNSGSWSQEIQYCASGNLTGTFPTSESCAEVVDLCDCLKDPSCNPDILPGHDQITSDIVSPALIALASNGVNPELRDALFIFGGGSDVMIEINFIDRLGTYSQVLSKYGITSTDPRIIYDGGAANTAVPSPVITLFFPIASLVDLDTTSAHKAYIRFVTQVSPSQGRAVNNIEEQGTSSGTSGSNISVTGSSLPNQGDFAQESFFTRTGYGLTGQGVNIGILSDSYDNGGNGSASNDVGNGYLPGDVEVVRELSPMIGSGIDEGRAMAQIVHSVAPAAKLYFHTGFESPGNMAEAIVKLATESNCGIIVDDITHPGQPFFGPGIVGKAIEQVSNNGEVFYFTSAGNFADRAYATTYSDLGGRHNFGGGNVLQRVNLGVGAYLIVLQWEDSFYSIDGSPGASNDFDIFLADDAGQSIYNFSRDNRGGDPVEIMPFYVKNPTTTNIVIRRTSGSGSPRIKYIVYKAGEKNQGFSPVDPTNYGKGTITGHATSPHALTIGAVRFDNTPTYGGILQTQGFSSRGDDAAVGKPDFTAVNGGNISFDLGGGDYAGDDDILPNFFGTSSSAPHAAAVAALLLDAKEKFNLAFDVPAVMKSKAIDYAEPSSVMGQGFLSAYNTLLGFANPSPSISQLDLSGFQGNPEDGGTLVIKGEYFVDGGTSVYFRDQLLEIIDFTDTSITVIIPAYDGGNPAIWVLNNSLAEGDGGADTAYFSDPIITPIDVIANDTSKRFGEDLPQFTFRTEPALSAYEMSLLSPYVDFFTNATALTESESFPSVNPYLTTPLENLAPELTELYSFNFVPGNLYIAPMELKITPKDFTVAYGSAVRDQIDYILEFGTPERPANINSANLESLKTGILQDYKASQANDLLILTDISLSNISLSNISLSNFISLSNISLSNISLSNLLQGKSFLTSFKTLKNISLSNISLSNISLSNISLSNSVNSGAVPLDISLFNRSEQWDGGTDFGTTYSNISLSNNALSNISLSNISLSNFISLSNAQVGASILNESLANISLSNISLSNFALSNISLSNISLSNISLSNISLSNISLSNFISLSNLTSITNISLSNGDIVQDYNDAAFRNFISLSNQDNTEILSIFEESEAQSDYDSIVPLFPINFISGLGAGEQIIAPATFLSDQYSKDFIVTYGLGNAEITEASIRIQTHDTTATYGDPLPNFRISIEGLQYLDSIDNVLERIDLINETTGQLYDGSAGVYQIVPVINNLNYQVVNTTVGTLTIAKAVLTVTADNQTKVYGSSNPDLTFQYSGWVNGLESIDAAPTPITTIDALTNVGLYPGSISLGGGFDNNYTFSFVAGDFEVTKAILTVTADNQTKVYGAPNPGLTFHYSGWVNGIETIDQAPAISTQINALSDAGDYSGSILLTGGLDNNYTFNLFPGNFKVTKALLTAIADPQTRIYGIANPPLTVTYTGFLNADDESVLISPAVASTSATCNSNVGIYTISVSGGLALNYLVTGQNGVLSITKAPMTIYAEDKFIQQGDPEPLYTFKAVGSVCGTIYTEVVANLSLIDGILDPSYGAAGVYTITPEIVSYSPSNYYIASLVPGKLYVNPIVGCNMKISASGLCKIAMTPKDTVVNGVTYTLTDQLRFEYTNPNSVPIYIPLGNNNGYKTKGNIFISGQPPVVFQPGTHSWIVKTTGNDIQWQVTTPGCNNFSKSSNGSNANPCPGSAIASDLNLVSSGLNNTNTGVILYPNPFDQKFTLDISQDLEDFNGEEVRLEVYDAIGRLINVKIYEQIAGRRFEVDLADLQSGVYLVKLHNNRENRIFKVLKR